MKIYWNDGTPINQKSKDSTLVIDCSQLDLEACDPIIQVKNAIDRIVKKYPAPYRLFLSGGVDSQAMAYAWKISGVEFQAVSFLYDQNMNSHDISVLYDFAKDHNIHVDYHNISHFDFLRNNLENYSEKYFCNSPHITFYMKMMERFDDGTLIFSGNPIITNPGIDYTILGLQRFGDILNKKIIPFFWLETKELAGSMYKIYRSLKYNPTLVDQVSNDNIKTLIYNLSGFPVESYYKKSGFEKYKFFYDNIYIDKKLRLKFLINNHMMPSKRNYDILFRYSLMQKNPYSQTIKIIGL